MGLNVKKAGVHILKALIFFIKACYRLIRYHPSILGLVLVFFLIYRFVPSVFNYVISSFPICVCTIVLIAMLVAFGRRHDISKVEEKRKSSQKTKLIKDDSIIEKDQKTCEEPELKKTIDIKEKAIEGVNLTQASKRKSTKRVTFSPITHDGSIGRTVITHQAKEIHEDSKQAIDKPVGEITDTHSKDPSSSSNDASLEKNEDAAESSGTGSNRAESSSPETSMVDKNPVTDGPHQVSDPQPSQPVLLSMDEIDGAPEESDRSNDDGFDSEEADKNGTKAAVTWTEDDEKNLMVLGSSELERNQRLESLMARRRARKKLLRMEAEKNLIDLLDSNDLPVQMAPLSIIKNNPFILPTTDNEIPGLPPLPGSAPSVLVPRTNPFDLPYDPQEEKPVLTGDSFHQEFMTVLQKDIYCRHESFCFGSTSYMGGLKDKCDNNIRTYSIIEDLASTEQRPLSERSDSTSSFVPDTELQSSIPDQEDQKKPIEEQLTQEGDLTSQIDRSAHSVDRITQSSEADLVEIHQDNQRDVEISLPDVVEEKYSGLSSPSSSSSSEFDNTEVESQNEEPTRGDFTEGPSLTSKDCDLKSGITVTLKDNNHPHEPFYDSSPSATEKRTIDESLFCVDKGVVLTSVSSIASDMQVEVSEVNSPSASSERNTAFTGEESLRYDENLGNEDVWEASSNLSAVDENESKSVEVTEISESDVIRFGDSGASRDSVDAISAASPVPQTLVDSNTAAVINEPINGSSMTQNPSSSAEPEMHERVCHQVQLDENVEPIASCSSTGQLLAEQSNAQPSMDSDDLKETQEPSSKSTEEEQIMKNVEDPVATDSDSTSSPSLYEPMKDDLISPIPSSNGEPQQMKSTEDSNAPVTVESNSTSSVMNKPIKEGSVDEIPFPNAEPETHNLVHQMNLKESVDALDTSSSPLQGLVEKSEVLPSIDGNQHEETLESTIKSTEEGNIVNDVKDPVVVDYNSTSSQLMNEPIEQGLINQIPSASGEPEMHNSVHQLNAEENVDPMASSSSSVQPLLEKSITKSSTYDDHHEEAQEPSMKSTEEGNIINDVKDPVAADSNSTSSQLINEPIKEGVNNQIPSSVSTLEMHNQVHRSNLKENMNPIASVQLLIEKSMVRPSVGGDTYDDAQEQSTKTTEVHDINNNVNDPAEINSNSTSSAINEPINEGFVNQNPLSTAEPDDHTSVHQLNLEKNVDPIASSSSSVQFLADKPTVLWPMGGDHHEEVLEPSTNFTEKDNIVNNVKDPGAVDSNATSSSMNQPITVDLKNQTPPPSAEPEMQNRAHKLNLEENVDPIASSSSPAQVLAGKSTVPATDGDHHQEAQQPSMNSTEKGNIITNVKDPGAVDSDSTLSLIHEPVKESRLNQNPTSGAEPELHDQAHQLDLEENVDPIVSSSTSSLINKPMEEGLMNNNPSSSAKPEMHNQVHQLNSGENVDPIVSDSTFSLMNEPMEDLKNPNPPSGAEPEMHNRVHQLNLEENEDPILPHSTSSVMNEPIEQGLINQNPSSSAESKMHNQVHHSNLMDNLDPIASSSSPELLVEKSTVPPSMDVDHQKETQVEPSIKSTDEDNTSNSLKDSILAVDEEKPKSIRDVEEDSKRSTERLVMVANLPETISEPGDNSFPDQRGSYQLQEATGNEVQKQVLEANHHLETEITSEHLHTEQEVQPIIPETTLESGTVTSTDHHPDYGISSNLPETTEISEIQKQASETTNNPENGTSKHLHTEQEVVQPIVPETILESGTVSSTDHQPAHGISSRLPDETEVSEIQKQASETTNNPENGTSEHLHTEQEVVHQLRPDETILESGVVTSADHGSYKLPETMESEIQNNEAFEENDHLGNDSSISKHPQKEKEFQQQVTPETTLESSRDVNSVVNPDDHGSNLGQTVESGTQKQLDFEANHDLEKETSKHLLHNEHEVVHHQQATPEAILESASVTPAEHPDHENDNLQQTMELSGTAFERNHHEKNEVNSKHLHNEQEEVHHQQATPETTLESASVTPAEHPEPENHNLQQTMEVISGTTQKQAIEENHLEHEIEYNEQEVVRHERTTPETVIEPAGLSSFDQADDDRSSNPHQPTERETSQKEAASEVNDQHQEKEKPSKQNQLHNEHEELQLTDFIC